MLNKRCIILKQDLTVLPKKSVTIPIKKAAVRDMVAPLLWRF